MSNVTNLAVTVFGVEIPSASPVFVGVLTVHVPLGLACVATGLGAALSPKHNRRHPRLGTAYYWCLTALCATAAVLAVMRWSEDYYLFILAVVSLGAATAGRWAVRRQRRGWVVAHILGMSGSYVVLITAFYLDNAKNLPLWRDLPTVAFWFLPAGVAVPFVARALVRHRDLARSVATYESRGTQGPP